MSDNQSATILTSQHEIGVISASSVTIKNVRGV